MTGQRRDPNRRPSARFNRYSPRHHTTSQEDTDVTSVISTELEVLRQDLADLSTRINTYTSQPTQSTVNPSDLRSLITDSLEKILTKENLLARLDIASTQAETPKTVESAVPNEGYKSSSIYHVLKFLYQL